MLIKIIRGTYGLNSGGNIKPKTCSDLPFHVEPAEAKRLERLGVAEIVGSSDDDDQGYKVEGVVEERDVPEYSEDSTNIELQAIAKEYGVELPPRANKAQILEALDDFFGGTPIISAKDPE